MNIIPRMPKEGSVGASGDLTPLSYLAAAVFGERQVYYKGRIVDTVDALQDCGITPLTPLPKETLALMNGTCVMTGLASLAYTRAQTLSKLSSLITALTSEAMLANRGHFDKRIFTAKPHPGQAICAQRIRNLTGTIEREKTRLQSPYSIRCAPHVTGVLEDSLPWIKEYTENEINSANDNPLIDPETGDFLHCGNFYGGHIGFAMDSLKNAVASVADLLDRQLALLVDPKTNRGLPANLSGAKGKEAAINHGFKAVQIGVSSWTAEALKNTMPAGSFSRSTECHNQDKVSMGTIAARDALRILELTEQCAAALLYASSQAFLLRMESGAISGNELPETLPEIAQSIINKYGRLVEDRELDTTINSLVEDIRTQVWEY